MCARVHAVLTRRLFVIRVIVTLLNTFSCWPSGGKINPNYQYFQQQQPGYGVPPLGHNYGGGMMPPRTLVMQP